MIPIIIGAVAIVAVLVGEQMYKRGVERAMWRASMQDCGPLVREMLKDEQPGWLPDWLRRGRGGRP